MPQPTVEQNIYALEIDVFIVCTPLISLTHLRYVFIRKPYFFLVSKT
ncbi:hypothetical protein [Polystyrenella longa]|nr:hypothetical protein [Polystyrenella longa]